jgi:hypothetical protein
MHVNIQKNVYAGVAVYRYVFKPLVNVVYVSI